MFADPLDRRAAFADHDPLMALFLDDDRGTDMVKVGTFIDLVDDDVRPVRDLFADVLEDRLADKLFEDIPQPFVGEVSYNFV